MRDGTAMMGLMGRSHTRSEHRSGGLDLLACNPECRLSPSMWGQDSRHAWHRSLSPCELNAEYVYRSATLAWAGLPG